MSRVTIPSAARIIALCALLSPAITFAGTQPNTLSNSKHFTLSQIFDLQWAADPQISPDGRHIVFVRSSFSVMKDKQDHSLWIINRDGSGLRPLTAPDVDATSPVWSPDGKRLLFVTATEKHGAELRLRWMDSGQTARLATLEHTPHELAWSPDGKRIAFSLFVPGSPPAQIADLPSKPTKANWGPRIRVIDRLVYRFNGRGYLPYGYTHLFTLSAEGGTPEQITSGDVDDNGSLCWTPDSKYLIFSANRHKDAEYQPLNSEIYVVSAEGGPVTALTNRNGPDRSPAISADGRQIAYLGFDDRHQGYQVTHLYVMQRDGSQKRVVAPGFDRSIRNPQWTRNGKGLVFQFDDQGITKLGYISLKGKVRTLADNVGGLVIGRPYAGGEYSFSPASGRLAFTLTSPAHPADVAVAALSARSHQKRLTDLNAGLLGRETLGTLEEIHYKSSFDGRLIEGWIMKPPGFNPHHKYPLILEIHGGPFANYGSRFSAEDQLYAAAGYVVLYINPRGSTSYGEKFGNLIHHDYPDHDYDDLMSGVDTILKSGYIDTKNLFVTGGSGGGVLTAWIVGHTHRFNAAVVAKPVINWYSWVLTSDLPSFGTTYWFAGLPWDHLQNYMRRSPISYAGNVRTPTMVMTGGVDYRTPSSEAEQFYEALKLQKVPAVMVRIPDANHEIAAKPSNMMAKVGYILGWFKRYRSGSSAEAR